MILESPKLHPSTGVNLPDMAHVIDENCNTFIHLLKDDQKIWGNLFIVDILNFTTKQHEPSYFFKAADGLYLNEESKTIIKNYLDSKLDTKSIKFILSNNSIEH